MSSSQTFPGGPGQLLLRVGGRSLYSMSLRSCVNNIDTLSVERLSAVPERLVKDIWDSLNAW
jgi:hypothetical protein